MALQLQITNAGRAALLNAANTGTAPTLLNQVGVTATAFVASAATAALPGEIKRLTTFAGDAVADDVIHLTIRDESADVYSMRGLALYLEGGVLFASYGQAGVILEKTASSMLLLAIDIPLVTLGATELEFGSTDFLNPPGTEDVAGVLRLATDAQTITGVQAFLAVTPKTLKAALDSRFGAGAPSEYIKPMLALASASLLHAFLGLGSAAFRAEGDGNLLDADKLDGQHGAWFLDRANGTGFQPIASVTGLQLALDGKAATGHTHIIADVAGLQGALDGKLASGHAGSSGAVHALATTGAHGFMSSGDKSKLDGIAAGATANATNADLRDRATHTGVQAIATVSGLQAAIDGKAAVGHVHAIADTTGLQAALDAKSATGHTHIIANVTGLQGALDAKAAISGQTFTGTISAPTTRASGVGVGACSLVAGSSTYTGFVEFTTTAGVRLGYIGFGETTSKTLSFVAENGGSYNFAVRPTFGFATPWDSNNLDPNSLIPAGAVVHYARNTAPTGWLKANGALVSRTTYAALFAAIGTTFGAGDGATTFKLPDLRGEFLRGWDDGRGVDAGRSFGMLQFDDFAAHTHPHEIYVGTSPSGGTGAVCGSDSYIDSLGSNSGSAGGSETRPRNVALLACIKY